MLIRHLVKRRKLVAAGFAAVAVVLVFGMSWLSLLNQNRHLLTQEADNVISGFDRLMGEVDAALAELNSRIPETCTRRTLLRMRRAMVMHPGVDDMLFFPPGSLVPACSANLGTRHEFDPLPEPISAPFTRNQRQYWNSLPLPLFGGEREASLIKEGAFAVAVDYRRYLYYPAAGDWQFYMPQPDGSLGRHSDGRDGLYQDFMGAQGSVLRRGLYHRLCSTSTAACIILHSTPSDILAREGLWLLQVPLRAAVLGTAFFFLANRFLAWRGSDRGRIRVALRRRRGFSCLYQPIVFIASGDPEGCEVLARFEDEFGPMMPDVFVPIVEELGSSWAFTAIIMDIAFTELEPLLARRPEFGISINFYPQDLAESRIPRLAACPTLQIASERGYRLHFEVIETAFGDLDSLSRTIDHLHSRGFLISIDDFGTGFSNLEQVQRLRADFVKIDRSFVHGLRPNSTSIHTSFVPQIIEIARKVNVTLIAEGIETPEQVQILKKLGVRLGQGYHFAPPLAFDDLLAFIEANSLDTGQFPPAPFASHI